MTTLTVTNPAISHERDRVALFGVFFASGFCGLLYQIVWVRIAFAHFGIITPVLSVVISCFMLGLGIGSLAAGKWGAQVCRAWNVSPVALYAVVELVIGIGPFAVPVLMRRSETLLLSWGSAGSASYLMLSSLAIAVSIVPWCVMMGTTYPLMMSYLRKRWPSDERAFSFLYRANVIGAAVGTLVSACILIELLGFRATSIVAAILNFAIAGVSFWMARTDSREWGEAPLLRTMPRHVARSASVRQDVILFVTGFSALAMEVVWTRAFTIVLWTTIYSFALILFTYLVATAIGAAIYRRLAKSGRVPTDGWLLSAAAIAACLPALVDDPRLQQTIVGVLLSIVPFCLLLGILTPKLIDAASGGDPAKAGRSYAVNVLGSILGPLVAGYGLVTNFDPRICLLLLAMPIVALATWAAVRESGHVGRRTAGLVVSVAVLLFGFLESRSYEEAAFGEGPHEVHRDYAATAIAYGAGMDKRLLVNGFGITKLSPITKVMAHLPLALNGHAESGLVICFGMGTTMRSMASWGIDTTAVDLTGSVIDSFDFFHADAAAVAARPNVHFVVDDGRRYLSRTDRSFDVIAIDPPPPIVAAGSSLLYSSEMYEVVKRHLRPHGILAQWYPGQASASQRAVARSLAQSFPYVVAFRSIEDWGVHFLASMEPIPELTPDTFAGRLPQSAKQDLMEWGPTATIEAMATEILERRQPMSAIVSDPQGTPIISDNKPFNEYFLLRTAFDLKTTSDASQPK